MAQLVTAPVRKARSGGIKDIVTFIEEERLGGPADLIVWDAAGCTFPSETRGGCYTLALADGEEAVAKTGVAPGQGQTIAPPFAQYAGVTCWLGGDNEGDTYAAQAASLLQDGEDRGVEAKLWDWATGAEETSTAAALPAAIGAADTHADANYVGQPVLLISRTNANLAVAAGVIAAKEGVLTTPTGMPVIASSQVPSDQIAVVGAIAVYATPIRSALGRDIRSNMDLAIAERVYSIGVDCDYRHIVTITAP